MPEDLTTNLAESLKTIETKHLFTMRLDVKPIVVIGQTPNGFKRLGIVPGGNFDGERLSGIVLEGVADWQTIREDKSAMLDVRLNLQTIEGDIITMYYTGIRIGATDILKKIDAGEAVNPEDYYFRTQARFETASAKYNWLNNILAIGKGHRSAEGVLYNLFEVL